MSRDLDYRNPKLEGRYLEAIITCVNYPDFLQVTLPHNKQYFDSVVVVTSFSDKETQQICRHHNIDPVITDTFYESEDPFNKARGINLGLSHLRYNSWVIHLDADILLPYDFRNNLFMNHLDKDCVYGADRQNVFGRKEYEKLIKSNQFNLQYRDKFIFEKPFLEEGARLVHREFGYCPIGYFQLFHGSYLKKWQMKYPDNQMGAERSDVQFALQWKKGNRRLLPATSVFHLESERSPQGKNWWGRQSAEF